METMYWTRKTWRMPESMCEDDEAIPVWIVGDETGPICEFTDYDEFDKYCNEREICH